MYVHIKRFAKRIVVHEVHCSPWRRKESDTTEQMNCAVVKARKSTVCWASWKLSQELILQLKKKKIYWSIVGLILQF